MKKSFAVAGMWMLFGFCAADCAAGQAAKPKVGDVGSTSGSTSETVHQEGEPTVITLGDHKTYLGIDLSFAGILDQSQQASLGRERQIKLAFANVSLFGDANDYLSFRVVFNPAGNQITPKPYSPSGVEAGTYFFPNQPEGHGAVSDPAGLYSVDDYKNPGFDPVLQQDVLRVAYVALHTRSRRAGVIVGRDYVPQGLRLDDSPWFTAKDLTHIQRINAQADYGATAYWDTPRVRVDLAGITGNGNPYHDYGYFDFTDAVEDKNSALGGVLTARLRLTNGFVGGTVRKNFVNSRIESATTVQRSKHYDDAVIAFASLNLSTAVRLFGEYAWYRWGLAQTSADLLPGPKVVTPVNKTGFWVGATFNAPPTSFGTFALTILHEELSRDDSLVSWAAANQLFGVHLGATERSTILKGSIQFNRQLTGFAFVTYLSNPFPQLSAIQPVAAGVGSSASNNKFGIGLRFRL